MFQNQDIATVFRPDIYEGLAANDRPLYRPSYELVTYEMGGALADSVREHPGVVIGAFVAMASLVTGVVISLLLTMRSGQRTEFATRVCLNCAHLVSSESFAYCPHCGSPFPKYQRQEVSHAVSTPR